MNFNELSHEEIDKINKKINHHYPDSDINIDDIESKPSGNGKIKFKYHDFSIELPEIDKSSMNVLIGGAIAITAVYVAMKIKT